MSVSDVEILLDGGRSYIDNNGDVIPIPLPAPEAHDPQDDEDYWNAIMEAEELNDERQKDAMTSVRLNPNPRNKLLIETVEHCAKAARAHGAQSIPAELRGVYAAYEQFGTTPERSELYHIGQAQGCAEKACASCPIHEWCPMTPEQLVNALRVPAKVSHFRLNLKKAAENGTLIFCGDVKK